MTCSACRVSPFRHPRIKAHVQLPAAFRSLSRLSSAPSARASALRPTMLNLFVSPSLALRLVRAVQKWFLTCPYRRICKACPSCSLVLLAIAFSIYIRVIDSNFFYQRRGLMFDVFSIQFSRYGQRIAGMRFTAFCTPSALRKPFLDAHRMQSDGSVLKKLALLRSCGFTQCFFKKCLAAACSPMPSPA